MTNFLKSGQWVNSSDEFKAFTETAFENAHPSLIDDHHEGDTVCAYLEFSTGKSFAMKTFKGRL